MANPILMLIAVPLFAGAINLILPRALQKIITALSLVYCGYLSFTLFADKAVLDVGGASIPLIHFFGLNALSLFALIAVQVLALIIFLFTLKGVEPKIERSLFVLYPLTLGFTNGAILADHAVALMVFWGLSGLMLYLFGMLSPGDEAAKTAQKTFLLIGGSDAFLILGLVLMGISLPAAKWSLQLMQIPLAGFINILAFVCLSIAAFTKAGGFPLHTWLPPYSQTAPVEGVAYLPAALDKILGIYLLARMVSSLFAVTMAVHLVLITIGAVTVITAVMMALTQHNGRRLLGYHAVSQVGYMIMGVGSGVPLAFAGGLFHLLNNAIYKSSLFLTLGSVEKKTGSNDLDDLGGLGSVMPLTCITGLIGALSISGIPPFNGFFSKWMIYQGLLEKAKDASHGMAIWLLACLVLAVFGSALTLASFLKFFHAIFLGRRPKVHDNVTEAPANQWLSTGLLSILCIVFGVFAIQIPLRQFIEPILRENGMAGLVYPGLYKSGVVLVMMGVSFLIALIVYVATRKVRLDDVYLGGMDALEKFRISGTEFYREIRTMRPLKSVYDWAEKQYCDLAEILSQGTIRFSVLFQKVHSGMLSLYLLFIVLGMLIFIMIDHYILLMVFIMITSFGGVIMNIWAKESIEKQIFSEIAKPKNNCDICNDSLLHDKNTKDYPVYCENCNKWMHSTCTTKYISSLHCPQCDLSIKGSTALYCPNCQAIKLHMVGHPVGQINEITKRFEIVSMKKFAEKCYDCNESLWIIPVKKVWAKEELLTILIPLFISGLIFILSSSFLSKPWYIIPSLLKYLIYFFALLSAPAILVALWESIRPTVRGVVGLQTPTNRITLFEGELMPLKEERIIYSQPFSKRLFTRYLYLLRKSFIAIVGLITALLLMAMFGHLFKSCF